MLEEHDIDAVSWQACVLPTREHALCLRVADGGRQRAAPRELLLRAKSKEQVQQAARQLAEHAQRAPRSQDGELEPAALEARLLAAGVRCPVPSHTAATPPPQPLAEEPAEPDPRSLSFGSPVADVGAASSGGGSLAGGSEDAASLDSRGDSPDALLGELGWGSDEEAEGAWGITTAHAGCPHVHFDLAADGCSRAGAASGAGAVEQNGAHPRVPSCSAPTSPVLPGLPLVASPAGAKAAPSHRLSASAPSSPTHAAAAAEPQATLPQPSLPVRLLSFSGRPNGSGVQSHIQRLEAAVAQLSCELAQSRSTAGSLAASPAKQPALAPAAVAEARAEKQQEQPAASAEHAGVLAKEGSDLPEGSAARQAAGNGSGRGSKGGSADGSQRADALFRENALLLEQQAAMQAELARMQGHLSAAAADNIRLASQAAAAVSQLASAADAMRAGQQRETELRASLAAAVGQCEAVGRELAGLSARIEAKDAQCAELRCGRGLCYHSNQLDALCGAPCAVLSPQPSVSLSRTHTYCSRSAFPTQEHRGGAVWREDCPDRGPDHRPAAAQGGHPRWVCSRDSRAAAPG